LDCEIACEWTQPQTLTPKSVCYTTPKVVLSFDKLDLLSYYKYKKSSNLIRNWHLAGFNLELQIANI
jgi:hypothetical protein